MFAVCVHVRVKPDSAEAFLAASRENAAHTVEEPGALRFDVLQEQDDPTRFLLYEVYRDEEAAAAHKGTAHYKKWRESVEDSMAEPRQGVRYDTRFPEAEARWSASE